MGMIHEKAEMIQYIREGAINQMWLSAIPANGVLPLPTPALAAIT